MISEMRVTIVLILGLIGDRGTNSLQCCKDVNCINKETCNRRLCTYKIFLDNYRKEMSCTLELMCKNNRKKVLDEAGSCVLKGDNTVLCCCNNEDGCNKKFIENYTALEPFYHATTTNSVNNKNITKTPLPTQNKNDKDGKTKTLVIVVVILCVILVIMGVLLIVVFLFIIWKRYRTKMRVNPRRLQNPMDQSDKSESAYFDEPTNQSSKVSVEVEQKKEEQEISPIDGESMFSAVSAQ